MNTNFINETVLKKWFTASTDADSQLQSFTENNDSLTKKRPDFDTICNDLFKTNPYTVYKQKNIRAWPATKKGLTPHIDFQTLSKLTEILPPAGTKPIGIEVGSFVGGSAILLGNFLKSHNGNLICIDTWCGDINMWLLDKFKDIMGKNDADPKLFHHFMNNIITRNLDDTIIPLRLSSIVGARLLKVLNYEIDFCYLDSAHEMGETFFELSLYYDLLKEGGILFGDDYKNFPAVKHDVDLFCNVYNHNLEFIDETTWMIIKK